MGSVTAPERAADTVELAKIAFGDRYLDPVSGKPNTVILSLIKRQFTVDLRRHDARRSQGLCAQQPGLSDHAVHPGRRNGAGHGCRSHCADPGRGDGRHGVRATGESRHPVVLGSFASSLSMQSGAPTFGTPEPALVLYSMAALARRLGVPFRSGGGLCASKIADAQAAYESANTMLPTCLAGVNFVLHTPGG